MAKNGPNVQKLSMSTQIARKKTNFSIVSSSSPLIQKRYIFSTIYKKAKRKFRSLQHEANWERVREKAFPRPSFVKNIVLRFKPEEVTWKYFKTLTFYEKLRWLGLRIRKFGVAVMNGFVMLCWNIYTRYKIQQLAREERRELTRSEYRFSRQVAADIKKAIPLLIAWKFLPLSTFTLPILIFLYPQLLPSTFEIGKKENDEQIFTKILSKKTHYLRKKRTHPMVLLTITVIVDHFPLNTEWIESDAIPLIDKAFPNLSVHTLSTQQLIVLLSSLNQIEPFLPLWPRTMLERKVLSHFAHLRKDDRYLLNDGLDGLTHQQLREACLERGLRTVNMTPFDLKYQLREWLFISLRDFTILTKLLIVFNCFYPFQRQIILFPSAERLKEMKKEDEGKEIPTTTECPAVILPEHFPFHLNRGTKKPTANEKMNQWNERVSQMK